MLIIKCLDQGRCPWFRLTACIFTFLRFLVRRRWIVSWRECARCSVPPPTHTHTHTPILQGGMCTRQARFRNRLLLLLRQLSHQPLLRLASLSTMCMYRLVSNDRRVWVDRESDVGCVWGGKGGSMMYLYLVNQSQS